MPSEILPTPPGAKLALTMSSRFIHPGYIKKPPSFFAHLYLMGAGAWLKLGDSDSDDVKSQAGNEQVNVSLVAALLFTVTTAYLFNIDQLDWAFAEDKWGAYGASTWHEFQLLVSFMASALNVLATLSSVVVLMINGELANNEEAAHFQDVMGLRQSMGFQLLMLSASLVGVLCVVHLIIFSYNNIATWIMIPLFSFFVWATLLNSFVPAIDALYKIKYAVHTTKPSVISIEQLGEYVERFCKEYGIDMLTQESVLNYIAVTREQDASVAAGQRGAYQGQRGMPTSLSPVSRLLLKTVVEKTMQRYVESQMKKSGSRCVDRIARANSFVE